MQYAARFAITMIGLSWLIVCACSASSSSTSNDNPSDSNGAPAPTALANVESVSVSGEPGSYTFSVTIRSPDQGCEQYANWWEVITTDGRLLYRRILGHSHVDEQPFTRSGGPVDIALGDEVVVRAHMHPGGYGGTALRGTVTAGFDADATGASLAPELAEAEPLPSGCGF